MENTQHHTNIQTSEGLINVPRVKIDDELDTITLNKYSTGDDKRDNKHRGYGSNRRKGKGGRNNVQVNRAGFNSNSRGERGNY